MQTNNICNRCKNTGYYSKLIGNMRKEKIIRCFCNRKGKLWISRNIKN